MKNHIKVTYVICTYYVKFYYVYVLLANKANNVYFFLIFHSDSSSDIDEREKLQTDATQDKPKKVCTLYIVLLPFNMFNVCPCTFR